MKASKKSKVWLQVLVFCVAFFPVCGRGVKVSLESVSVGGISVGMDLKESARLAGCTWETYLEAKMRGPTALVCPGGKVRFDLQPMGWDTDVEARIKLYAPAKSTKISGYAIYIDPPLMVHYETLATAITQYYEKVIGKPPQRQGKTYFWRISGRAFMIQPDEENARVIISIFPPV